MKFYAKTPPPPSPAARPRREYTYVSLDFTYEHHRAAHITNLALSLRSLYALRSELSLDARCNLYSPRQCASTQPTDSFSNGARAS